MVWIGAALAAVLALAMTAFTATILRRLPPPKGEPGARPYSELISRRLLLTVLAGCLAALGLAFQLAPVPTWPVWGALGTLGVLLAVVDSHTGFLPLRLTWALAVLVALGAAVTAWWASDAVVVMVAALCALGAWMLFLLFWRIGGGIGFGDVRLAPIIAGAAGTVSLDLATWSLLLGGVVGVIWGLVLRIRRGEDGPFPYGPSLLAGPFAALVLRLFLGS